MATFSASVFLDGLIMFDQSSEMSGEDWKWSLLETRSRICFVHRLSRQRFANRRFDDSPNATGNRGTLSPIDAFPLKSPATSSRFGTSFLKRRARQAVKRIARFRNARICGCLFSRQFHRQRLTVPSKQLAYHPCSSMEYSIYPYMVCFFNL